MKVVEKEFAKFRTISVDEQELEGLAALLVDGLTQPDKLGNINNYPFFAYLKLVLLDDENPLNKYVRPRLRAHGTEPSVIGLVGEVSAIRTLLKSDIDNVLPASYEEDVNELTDCFVSGVPIQIKTSTAQRIETKCYDDVTEFFTLTLANLHWKLAAEHGTSLFGELRAETSALLSAIYHHSSILPSSWEKWRINMDGSEKFKHHFDYIFRLFEALHCLEQLKCKSKYSQLITVNVWDIDWGKFELIDQSAAKVLKGVKAIVEKKLHDESKVR